MHELKDILKKYRIKEELNQEEMGKKLDISFKSYHKIEKGKVIPMKKEFIERLITIFSSDINYLQATKNFYIYIKEQELQEMHDLFKV